jgi:hypothetical protein
MRVRQRASGRGHSRHFSMAAEHGLINLADAFERIKQTNFHYLQETMDQLLAESGSDHRP